MITLLWIIGGIILVGLGFFLGVLWFLHAIEQFFRKNQ